MQDLNEFDCILGNKLYLENYKISKVLKHYVFNFILNPSKIFFKKKRSIAFHFDIYHGKGNLDLAINLLEKNEREEFRNYVHTSTFYNPHNMFICKKKFLRSYYESVFPWLFRCEKLFPFTDLEGYGKKRIFGFLAERYLSYWFNKYCSVKENPIIHMDLSNYK